MCDALRSALPATRRPDVCPLITQHLKISPHLAGVTFLSFGNGASDAFASLASFMSGQGQIGVSAILGAVCALAATRPPLLARPAHRPEGPTQSVFITTVVVGAVAMMQETPIDRWPHVRDVSFNLIATAYMAVVFGDGDVTTFEAAGFVGIYAMFAM